VQQMALLVFFMCSFIPLPSEYAEDVKGTLRYLISKRFPHSGNYPSSEGNPRDKLVQWSHGATGMAITLSKAAQVIHYLPKQIIIHNLSSWFVVN
jgi:hypothetical protein